LDLIDENYKLLEPMPVAYFVDFKRTGRGCISRPGGWREREGVTYTALLRDGRPRFRDEDMRIISPRKKKNISTNVTLRRIFEI